MIHNTTSARMGKLMVWTDYRNFTFVLMKVSKICEIAFFSCVSNAIMIHFLPRKSWKIIFYYGLIQYVQIADYTRTCVKQSVMTFVTGCKGVFEMLMMITFPNKLVKIFRHIFTWYSYTSF